MSKCTRSCTGKSKCTRSCTGMFKCTISCTGMFKCTRSCPGTSKLATVHTTPTVNDNWCPGRCQQIWKANPRPSAQLAENRMQLSASMLADELSGNRQLDISRQRCYVEWLADDAAVMWTYRRVRRSNNLMLLVFISMLETCNSRLRLVCDEIRPQMGFDRRW